MTPDYTRLPDRIRLEDTVAEHDTRPVPDPEGHIDANSLFMLRYAG